jgi:hypothetical protein
MDSFHHSDTHQYLISRLNTHVLAVLAVLALVCLPLGIRAQSTSPSAPQDGLRCNDAISFCQTTYRTPFLTDSTFLQEPMPVLPCIEQMPSIAAPRVNGVWYKITVYQNGDLGFGIQPMNQEGSLNRRVNLDWALFRLTDSTACGRLGEPIRCNSATLGGLTGAIETAPDDPNNTAFSEPIRNVKPGDVFLLLVLNPDNHRFGYTLDMGFSSAQNLTAQLALNLKSLSAPRSVCQTNTLTVEISDNVMVSAATSGVFSLMSSRGVRPVITQVASQRFGITTSASAEALDNVFTLFLANPIEQSETYTLSIRQALPSVCQSLTTSAQISAAIAVGPRVEITGFREYCSNGAKLAASSNFRSYFWDNVRTGQSVGNTRTVTVPEGEYRLTVIDNNGCQATTSAIIRSTTAITLALGAQGGKTSFCNYGDGRDGVLLQATPGFDRYEWFFNGSPTTGIATTGTTSEKYVVDSPGFYSVRAYVNGCESVSSSLNVTMYAAPAKPTVQRIGNYLSVVNPPASGANYYWIRRTADGKSVGIENGWECSPTTNGTYFVRLSNQNGCSLDSDTLGINITPVRMRLETGSYSAEQSRQFDMQFRLAQLLNSAEMVGATSITFTLRFNAGLLWLYPSSQRGVLLNRFDSLSSDRSITVTFNLPPRSTSTPAATNTSIGTLRFLATVPSAALVRITSATRLHLENITCLTPTGKIIQGIRVDTTLGSFSLQNAGKFFGGSAAANDNAETISTQEPNDTETVTIAAHPNPTSGGLTIDFSLASPQKETIVSVWLQDIYGKHIKTLVADKRTRTGIHSQDFDVSDVPRGTYFLIVRTANTYRTAILSVTR